MSQTRLIGISTTNPIKVKEIAWDFAPYGIEVVQVPKPLDNFDKEKFFSTEMFNGKKFKPIYILQEQSELYRTNLSQGQMAQLEPVTHISKLIAHGPDNSTLTWASQVSGYIDLTRKTSNPEVFDWDDVFVVSGVNKTYWELSGLNHKYSARDKNISQFIGDKIYYKSNIDLKHFPQKYTQCVDFSRDPSKFILSVEEFSNPIAKKLNLSNIPINALNNGMFYRSAINRRQKLYWCPGLNAGIPFVPKPKDRSHELTFMFHDFSHFAIPDLVFDGTHTPLTQKVYIGYRLMSEAITLVLADMLFVYSMLNTSFEYKTVEARKIYPVFARLYGKLFDGTRTDEEAIRILLQGSFEYCFYGDLSLWASFMDQGEETDRVIGDFSGKYDNYFLEDFRWTNLNYNYMKAHAGDYTEWWKQINPILTAHAIGLYSVTEWIELFSLDKATNSTQLNQMIFDSVYSTWIKPLLAEPIELSDQKSRLTSMFVRYMCGQSQIFFRFNPIEPESLGYWTSISNTLKYLAKNPISDEIIGHTRSLYGEYLKKLCDKSLISQDDYNTWVDIYPIFKPFIVDYDGLEESASLAEFSELMLTT